MDSSRRRPLSDLLGDDHADNDLEEGEYVPGHHYYESSDDDDRFDRSLRREDYDEAHLEHGGRMRRLEDIIAVGRAGSGAGAPPLLPASPTPSSESEGTVSDDDHNSASSAGGAVTRHARRFACHVCGKRFSSRKAVDGHMRVHGSGTGRHVVAAPAAFAAGWAATGRRGSTRKSSAAAAASLNSESTGHSTAIVAVQVKPLEPVPMAFAMPNLSPMPSSTRTNLSGEDDEGSSASATATTQPMHYDDPAAAAAVVTGANPFSTGAAARAAGPVDHQLAAAAYQQAPPALQVHRQAVSVPPPAAQQSQHQPLVPPPPAAGVQLQQGQLVPRPAQPPREYSCKVCGKTYSTHQGLGGHAAGHRNRQREQEAMAAAAGMMMPHDGGEFLAALRRGRKAEQPHKCQKCGKVFATGVALGGHMRMHYDGPPIVHKSKKRCVALVPAPPPPAVSEADLRLALSTAKAEEPSSSSPAPAVAGTGRLRLFGIDIGPLGQAPPSDQQGSGSGTTEGGCSSSAGEQQHK